MDTTSVAVCGVLVQDRHLVVILEAKYVYRCADHCSRKRFNNIGEALVHRPVHSLSQVHQAREKNERNPVSDWLLTEIDLAGHPRGRIEQRSVRGKSAPEVHLASHCESTYYRERTAAAVA